jgi:hypothetical protein
MTDTLLSAAKSIQEGDLVMVAFPISEKTNNPAHRLDGEEFVVKTKRKPVCKKGGDIYLYELFGAASKAGVPYTFLTDELIKL